MISNGTGITIDSPSSLFDSLQREFCPPLDSSLLAALIAEIELDADSQIRKPSSIQVQELRSNLYQLAAQADESQLSELTDLNLTSPTDETGSSPDFFHRSSATTSSLTSASENPPLNSFDSPLGFLKAALPDVSTRTLNAALLQAGIGQGDEPDMWEIITDILSRESIREMEERGIEGLDGDEDLAYQLRDDEITWETVVSKKKKPRETIKAKKPRASRATKFSIVDIRQRQHGQPRNKNKPSSAVPDPWVQLSSLAEYVSSFVTPHPASLFLSFFHAPNYSTPYEALRNALNSICRSTTAQPQDELCSSLLEVLDAQYGDLTSEQRSCLISDIHLSVQATNGRGDDALDLINLLRRLDSDSSSVAPELGVFHAPPQSPVLDNHKAAAAVPTKLRVVLPSGPPSPPPPPSKAKIKPAVAKQLANEWQQVPQRKVWSSLPSSHVHHIPAYAHDVNGFQVKKNRVSQGGKDDNGEVAVYKSKMVAALKKRDKILMEAAKYWRRGNSNTKGGEVALFYAQQAREFQEVARKEALNAARAIVESKRLSSIDQDTIDLHGTTIYEANVIVKETLLDRGASQGKPLKIITGRGTHSANQVGVLKPAVKKGLVADGWIVGSWDGGLIVRGRRAA